MSPCGCKRIFWKFLISLATFLVFVFRSWNAATGNAFLRPVNDVARPAVNLAAPISEGPNPFFECADVRCVCSALVTLRLMANRHQIVRQRFRCAAKVIEVARNQNALSAQICLDVCLTVNTRSLTRRSSGAVVIYAITEAVREVSACDVWQPMRSVGFGSAVVVGQRNYMLNAHRID